MVERAIAVDEILFELEGFTRVAIPTLVLALVNVTGVENALKECLHRGSVARLGGPNEIVERDVELCPDVFEFRLHRVAVGEWLDAELLRLLEHVERVLVVSHDEVRFVTVETLESGDDVGGHFLVSGPQVGTTVDVIDCGREVELGHVGAF